MHVVNSKCFSHNEAEGGAWPQATTWPAGPGPRRCQRRCPAPAAADRISLSRGSVLSREYLKYFPLVIVFIAYICVVYHVSKHLTHESTNRNGKKLYSKFFF